MTVTGSDLSVTESGSLRAVFHCTEESVTVEFYYHDESVLKRTHSRADAVGIGKLVAETGLYDGFPISGIALSDMKAFGTRLRQYGQTGK